MLGNIMILLHVAPSADTPAGLGEGAGVLQVAGGPAAGALVLEVAPSLLQTQQSIYVSTLSIHSSPLTW